MKQRMPKFSENSLLVRAEDTEEGEFRSISVWLRVTSDAPRSSRVLYDEHGVTVIEYKARTLVGYNVRVEQAALCKPLHNGVLPGSVIFVTESRTEDPSVNDMAVIHTGQHLHVSRLGTEDASKGNVLVSGNGMAVVVTPL